MTATPEEDFRDFVVARGGPTSSRWRTSSPSTGRPPAGSRPRRSLPCTASGAGWSARGHRARRPATPCSPGPSPPPATARRHGWTTVPAGCATTSTRWTTRTTSPWPRCCRSCGEQPRSSGPRSPPRRCGAWTRDGSPTCSGCRPPPSATPTSPCAVASSPHTPRPGWRPGGSPPSGPSTATSTTPSTCCWTTSPSRRTSRHWSGNATGRCGAARSCSAPGPRWPPGSSPSGSPTRS